MTEERPPEENLTDELRRLGKNLSEALRSAWESPERRRLQQELEVEDVRQKVRSGEAETRVREELVNALRTVNAELQKVSERWASQETGGKEGEQAPEKHEIHPDDVDSTSPEPPRQEIHPDDVDSGTRA
jgi:hypothetical protein